MKDTIKGRPITRIEEFANGVLRAPDGRPVDAISYYTDAAPPADGRPIDAVSTVLDEGEFKYAVSAYPAGTLVTIDGRPVWAAVLCDAAGVPGSAFTPASLFASSEQGAWYDPSDLSSMYQDSSGNTAAVVNQPVGLLLDKRLRIGMGPELATNGDFSSATGWYTIGTIFTVAGGTASATGDRDIRRLPTETILDGDLVECTIVISAIASGLVQAWVAGNDFSPRGAPGTYTERLVVGTAFIAEVGMRSYGGATGVVIDSISFKRIPGNHAKQATTAAKPVLRQSGALDWLEFDGVDDFISSAFTLNQPFERVGAYRNIIYGENTVVIGGGSALAGLLNLSNNLYLFAGSVAVSTNENVTGASFVCTELFNGALSSIRLNGGATFTGNPGANNPGGVTIGAGTSAGGNPSNIRFSGAVVRGSFTAEERANLRTYLAGKSGVTL